MRNRLHKKEFSIHKDAVNAAASLAARFTELHAPAEKEKDLDARLHRLHQQHERPEPCDLQAGSRQVEHHPERTQFRGLRVKPRQQAQRLFK
ncbi:hypothetical protein CEP52_001599 [Fusarium oligoseptatum]|uniref:Uncharacterized protein n=1 Tax=Fusarium oligoseptatum TaxID=2604345 RepID=A0A428UI23_9HYPO|nr:hypothetical protein CEP52_001599 [Fusarium oligoseptatum]